METEHDEKKKAVHRGAYILPSAFTTANIFCGFYAITSVWNGDLDSAAKAIGIAIVLDGFDGRIARMMGATSKFGLQLDSLADAISFGVAPATLMWAWHLKGLGYLGWIAAFLYMICGIMRLARFNVQSADMKHFLGLPIPAAAGLVASLAHFYVKYQNWIFFKSPEFPYILVALAAVLGVMMISTIRYGSFKSLSVRQGNPRFNILLIALLIAGIWFLSHEVLLLFAFTYLISGITGTIRRKIWPRSALQKNPDEKGAPTSG
jgi:CDP-diacylglycerol---serine O-phosphatidyltransferase